MATKERSKIEKPNPRRPAAKTSPVKHAQTNAELRQQLAGQKAQMDDPDEVRRLEQEIAAAEAEIVKLKAS